MKKNLLISIALLASIVSFADEVTYPQVVGRGTGKFTITVSDADQIMEFFNESNANYENWALVRQATDLKIISAEGTTVELSGETNAYNISTGTDLGVLCKKFDNLNTLDLSGVTLEYATSTEYSNSLNCLGQTSKFKNLVLPIQNGLCIGQDCFARHPNLESIIIPDYPAGSTYTIGTTAFARCPKLTSVSLGKGTSSVGGDAIVFPEGTYAALPNAEYWNEGVEGGKPGKGVFSGCTNLYSVVLDDDITCLREETFSGCTSLEYVKLPDHLTTIGGKCFLGCTSMKTVTIPATMRHWGGTVFANMYNLTDVYLLADDIPLPYGGDQGGPFLWDQTSSFRYDPTDPQNPTYSTADYKYTKNDGRNFKMPILHYSGTEESIRNYRWTDSQGYSLVDPDGTTWPDNENIRHFSAAKDKTPSQGGFKDDDDIYRGWKFFLQGNQNQKRDDIIDLDRFTESRWYSVCFPFDLTIDKFQNTFGARAALSEFSGITYDEESHTLTIRFEDAAVDWQKNNVILRKNHAYMIHPDKLAVPASGSTPASPLQIFNVDNNLEHYRLASVLEQKRTVVEEYNTYVREHGEAPGNDSPLKKKYDQWSKVLDNNQVDAANKTYNETVWTEDLDEPDGLHTPADNGKQIYRVRRFPLPEAANLGTATYYFKGNYMEKGKLASTDYGYAIPQGSYYLGGSIAAGNYGFYYRKSTGSTWTPYTAILVPDNGTTSAPAKISTEYIEDLINEYVENNLATSIENEITISIPLKNTGNAYNMQGQLVGTNGTKGLSKGLYIVNGKKYSVK